jgi:hypothetical protein
MGTSVRSDHGTRVWMFRRRVANAGATTWTLPAGFFMKRQCYWSPRLSSNTIVEVQCQGLYRLYNLYRQVAPLGVLWLEEHLWHEMLLECASVKSVHRFGMGC